MKEFRQRLYPTGFPLLSTVPPIFSRANLDPHYRPFRGIVWSILVHASIFTALVSIPLPHTLHERPSLRDQAVIIDVDELDDVLYLPALGASAKNDSSTEHSKSKNEAVPGKEGLSYPGPQPIVSNFPKITNHSQTILQPALVNPPILEPPLTLPNLVRLAPPPAEAKFKVPDNATAALQPPTPLAPINVTLNSPARPLAAPTVETKFKLTEPANPVARPSQTVSAVPPDVTLSAPARALAAPAVEPRFKLPDSNATIARPTLSVPVGPPDIALSAPSRPLAAPLAESKFKVADAAAAPKQATPATTALAPVDLPTGPARPLAAPIAESKFKTTDSAGPIARPNIASTAPVDVAVPAPARPLAAPVAESKFKTPDAAAPAARPTTASVPALKSPALTAPAAPLAPPKPAEPAQNLLTLSPTPARRDQQVVIPAGEARGQFAISPEPNLTFPGTEPGSRGGNGTSTGSSSTASSTTTTVAGLVNLPPNPNNRGNGSTSTTTNSAANGAGKDAFAGITILGGADSNGASASRNSVTTTPTAGKTPEPLQTSYGITILASGRSGGGLPDFGMFSNEQVHTAYLDMRRTIDDTPLTWTVEFGVPPRPTTAQNERLATVGSQQEVLLPFPITKERPTMPADVVRKFPGRMVIAYAVVTVEGKVEQLAIKESPDPRLNDLVLSALSKWTFRPARRDGEIVSAKMLLGIPLRAD